MQDSDGESMAEGGRVERRGVGGVGDRHHFSLSLTK